MKKYKNIYIPSHRHSHYLVRNVNLNEIFFSDWVSDSCLHQLYILDIAWRSSYFLYDYNCIIGTEEITRKRIRSTLTIHFFLFCTLFSVKFILLTVNFTHLCKLYTFSVKLTLFSVNCTLFSVKFTPFFCRFALFKTVILLSCQYKLYIELGLCYIEYM